MRQKILVVDDEPDAREALSFVLNPIAEILEAADGAEALRRIAADRPDLVLLDIAMPGLGGLDVLVAGLRISPGTIVVMLTCESDIAVAKKALDRGARAYITKPVDPLRLRGEIQDMLGRNAQLEDTESKTPWRVIG